ncbi:MAG: transglycosylase SLT domain-containing protein [Pseudoflavonifractor sp.]|nr:transglycosylase SLT domain-containing protein [Alloprevotella sp.]MCM1115954.1 transglycosylase SLT domain-containing protein [Pseudoflavonifractor sp.]
MHRHLLATMLSVVAVIALTVGATEGCSTGDGRGAATVDTAHHLPDTLRVVTLYSPTSYFIYRGQPMGYDYDLVERLAEDKHMVLKLEVAPSLNAAVDMLDSGKVDLIAYEVPVTAEYKGRVIPAGPENITTQVLVQPSRGDSLVKDVTDLVGRRIYVEEGSKYEARLANLNEELGGGIDVCPVDRDTLITEDLIGMVDRGEIPLTIVDSDVAAMNRGYYPGLDISLPLSFEQRSAWGVAPGKEWLADSIDVWAADTRPRQEQALLLKRYFEQSKGEYDPTTNFANGRISPYDELFKKYAKEIGWDWRLLAAQAHTESKFKPRATSWAGARGLMQIMPATARDYGVSAKQLYDPETSIRTAVKFIGDLDKWLKSRIPDDAERQKFILAAYNAGVAHVYDAIALARKYKLGSKWNGGVEKAILMKMNPRYYRDPVVKYGYSRGRETYDYVRRIYSYYNKAKDKVAA